MEIRPIFSALLRSKTGPILIALQIAVTLAVAVNAAFVVMQRVEKISRPTGMDVDSLIAIVSVGFGPEYDNRSSIREDIEALRALPGVVDAVPINQVPLSGGGDAGGYRSDPATPEHEEINANNYYSDEHIIETLGLKLVAGRRFRPEEVHYREPNSRRAADVAIITQALADELFPDGDALGKPMYSGQGDPMTVIGIVERMHGAWVSWDGLERVVLRPEVFLSGYTIYMIRAEDGLRDTLMPQVEDTLSQLNDDRILRRLMAHSEVVARSYSRDRAMAVILVTVTVLFVAITALGIVGLASFTVSQRTKQIGTRRAIGARRLQILRYFLVENAMITTGGIIAGAGLALAFNVWLVTEFELPKLEFVFLLGGVVSVLLLGQLAVLGPARRAAAVPPAVATRTV